MLSRTTERLRIIVTGYVVRGPLGGMAWHFLQYVRGLADLGHDVYYVEDSDDVPFCLHPWMLITDRDPKEGIAFTSKAFADLALEDRFAYYDAHTGGWLGPCAGRILEVCRTADLLLSVAAWINPLRPWLAKIPARAFLDTDPAFTQIVHLTNAPRKNRASQYTSFFSFGENILDAGCGIPDDGFPWQTTRQPIVLDAWPVTRGPEAGKFTTILDWHSYYPVEHKGVRYGMKSDSFGPYMDLPRSVDAVFGMAVGRIPPDTVERLRAERWSLVQPRESSIDLTAYQSYLRKSKAEFSVAKHGYVVSRSGWFSERSAAYMASGRPVLLQDTGFSDWLPTGLGILAFNNPAEAVTGIEDVNANYGAHCRAAREIAAEYFDSRKVLTHLIEQAMNSSSDTFCQELSERA